MTTIKDVYDDLNEDLSFEEFEQRVEKKVEEMGGLLDKHGAAVLVAGDGLSSTEVQAIDEITADMEEVQFFGKVLSIGDLNTFSRENSSQGTVCNIEVADETGQVRVALWDEMAEDAVETLEIGDVLNVSGTPKDGYSGLEVSADSAEVDNDRDIDVEALESYQVADLSPGLSSVTIKGLVLGTTSINTFERGDGSEGQVANVIIGDKTGEIQVTMWGEAADAVNDYRFKQSVEITNGDVQNSDDGLEIHINNPDDIAHIKEQIEYVPDPTPIGEATVGETINIAGGVTYLGEKETFERDDGSNGKVRNLNLEDDSGSIRVSLWGDKAEMDLNVGDEVLITDAEIQEGWEDEPEASTGYQSTTLITGRDSYEVEDADAEGGEEEADTTEDEKGGNSSENSSSSPTGIDDYSSGEEANDEKEVEVSGMVLSTGEEITIEADDEEITVTGGSDFDIRLGQTVTVRGIREEDGTITAIEVF